MSSLYADNAGPGSVAAAQMAVADFGGTVLGKKIEVVSADNLNKADVGASIARRVDRPAGRRRHCGRAEFRRGARRAGNDPHQRTRFFWRPARRPPA